MKWGWEKHYPGPEGSMECKRPLGLDPFSLPLCWFLLGCSPVARFFLFCVLLQSFSLMRASAAICASPSSPQQGCAPPRSACRAGCSSLSNLPHISCAGLPASRDGEEGRGSSVGTLLFPLYPPAVSGHCCNCTGRRTPVVPRCQASPGPGGTKQGCSSSSEKPTTHERVSEGKTQR